MPGQLEKDPVSGNTIPPGGTAEGVRDDIEAKLSDGEFVVPANVVQFLGVDKLQKMVEQANEKLAMSEGHNPEEVEEEMDEDDLPFPEEELVGYAQGGLVEEAPFSGIRPFTDAQGQTRYIPFFEGNPYFEIPEGYAPVAENVQAKAPTVPAQQPVSPSQSNSPAPVAEVKAEAPRTTNQQPGQPSALYNKGGLVTRRNK